ncbi:M91 family zinc metallopeptidase [Pseudomonas simiae]|uniref:M91 family zinc metallopeptidase n=1 Tax=Pseudomonas simiae TaxID=321846 RepID=UPI0027361083|nr:M91 family zinc metallopeptidase [Pseudomonas simiae]WLI22890.1 M91 family zinc metallopeptidase [Pseudomonas simiae]
MLQRAALESGIPVAINELSDTPSTRFSADPATRDGAFIENGHPGTPSYGGQIGLNTTDTRSHQPSIIALFHQLCHAYNHITGTRLHGFSEAAADGNQARIQVSNEELQALGLPTSAEPFDFDNDPATAPTTTNPEPFSENGLRRELGLPPRLLSEHYTL